MYDTPYIFHFVHPLVKTAEIMIQRVNFERNLKNIRPAKVFNYKTAFFCACQTELIKNENKITIIVFLCHWCSSFLALKKVNFMWLTSFLLETGELWI